MLIINQINTLSKHKHKHNDPNETKRRYVWTQTKPVSYLITYKAFIVLVEFCLLGWVAFFPYSGLLHLSYWRGRRPTEQTKSYWTRYWGWNLWRPARSTPQAIETLSYNCSDVSLCTSLFLLTTKFLGCLRFVFSTPGSVLAKRHILCFLIFQRSITIPIFELTKRFVWLFKSFIW